MVEHLFREALALELSQRASERDALVEPYNRSGLGSTARQVWRLVADLSSRSSDSRGTREVAAECHLNSLRGVVDAHVLQHEFDRTVCLLLLLDLVPRHCRAIINHRKSGPSRHELDLAVCVIIHRSHQRRNAVHHKVLAEQDQLSVSNMPAWSFSHTPD